VLDRLPIYLLFRDPLQVGLPMASFPIGSCGVLRDPSHQKLKGAP
jgi:hypothetical protein